MSNTTIRGGCLLLLSGLKVGAGGFDDAATAFGSDGFADGLAEPHQGLVDPDPVFGGKEFFQVLLHLSGDLAAAPTQTAGDAEYMGVNGDSWFSQSQRHYQIGGFAAHSRQGDQLIQALWELPQPTQMVADAQDILCLLSIKPHRIDQFLDFLLPQEGHFLRCVGKGEQFFRCLPGYLILGA